MFKNFKIQLILVIASSILIGILVIQIQKNYPKTSNSKAPNSSFQQSSNQITPNPTIPPLTKDSNLLEETKKLNPPDLTSDFDNLKKEVLSF